MSEQVPGLIENEIGAIITYGLVGALPALSLAKFRAEMLKGKLFSLTQMAQRITVVGYGLYMLVRRQAILHNIEESARLRLETANQRVALTIAKFGPTSQEAREAERTLVIAKNMQTKAQLRTSMMVQAQYLQVFSMAMGLMFTMKRLHLEWVRATAQAQDARNTANVLQMAKNKRLLAMRTVLFAASLATSIAVNVLTLGIGIPGLDAVSQAAVETAPDEMHAGGVSGHGGLGFLEQGETTSATKWFTKPLTITLKPPPGTPESEVARELFDRVAVLRGE